MEEEVDSIRKTAKEDMAAFEEPAKKREMALKEERERIVERIMTKAQLKNLKTQGPSI